MADRAGSSIYSRLLVGAVVVNALWLTLALGRRSVRLDDGTALHALTAITLVDLAIAVAVRQQAVLNVVYECAGRARRSWSLPTRRLISNVHHIGGLHAGCAISGSASMALLTASVLLTRSAHPGAVSALDATLCVCITVVLAVIVACAAPPVRMKAHDVFEQTHRWGGWTSVVLYAWLTVHLAAGHHRDAAALRAVATDWHCWVVTAIVASIAAPWVRLRRVPISVERPSAHVAIVTLDYGVTPSSSSAVGISRTPLDEWHAFATVTTPGRSGYRLLISRAGDWTGRFIDDPPTHVWVRGVPVSAPMAKVAVLYQRVVYVVTGSGIGPCLGQILADRVPARLVWSTRSPRRTYGDALVDEVAAVQPDAVIWDTTDRGTPDLLALALDAVDDFDAEAVFIVSNKPTTLALVAELERRGIPAFGPIWDS